MNGPVSVRGPLADRSAYDDGWGLWTTPRTSGRHTVPPHACEANGNVILPAIQACHRGGHLHIGCHGAGRATGLAGVQIGFDRWWDQPNHLH